MQCFWRGARPAVYGWVGSTFLNTWSCFLEMLQLNSGNAAARRICGIKTRVWRWSCSLFCTSVCKCLQMRISWCPKWLFLLLRRVWFHLDSFWGNKRPVRMRLCYSITCYREEAAVSLHSHCVSHWAASPNLSPFWFKKDSYWFPITKPVYRVNRKCEPYYFCRLVKHEARPPCLYHEAPFSHRMPFNQNTTAVNFHTPYSNDVLGGWCVFKLSVWY